MADESDKPTTQEPLDESILDQPMPMKKLFISELDTCLGKRIVEKFAKTGEYEIVGTMRNDARRVGVNARVEDAQEEGLPVSDDMHDDHYGPLPPYVKAICPCYDADHEAFKAAVLDADVIVCPLRDSITEAAAAIRMLSNIPFEVEKTFVLVSSLLTWANTYKAQKAEVLAQKAAERAQMIADGEEPPEDEPEEEEEEEIPVFTEDQYHGRVPHQRFQHWKEVEHSVKVANSETLHTYVLFGGLTYGGEEDMLEPLFKTAWHREPLPMFTNGQNVVPMIHVDDLANATFKAGTLLDTMAQRYIIGADRGNNTWGQVIKAINDNLGEGKTFPEPRVANYAHSDWFTMDLRVDGAGIFELLDEGDWVAPEGFTAAIEKVVQEYKEAHKLTPIRCFITGAPHSGKTALAERLCANYRLNHLTVPTIVERYKEHRDDLQQEIRDYRKARVEEKKAAAREEKRRAAAEAAAAEEEARAAAEAGEDGAEGETPEPGADGGANDDEDGNGAGDGAAKEWTVEFDDDEEPPQGEEEGGTGGAAEGDNEKPEGEEDNEDGADGEDGGEESKGPPEDADDDPDDELLNKMKEDLTFADRVLSLKPSKTSTRYLDAALAVMARYVLMTKRCRNQGYILDGFPKTPRQASLLYLVGGEVPLPEPDDEGIMPSDEIPADMDPSELQATIMAAVDDALLFDTALIIKCSEQLMVKRCVESDPHRNLAHFYERLEQYKKNNLVNRKPTNSLECWVSAILTNKEGLPRAISVHTLDASNDDRECRPTIELVSSEKILGTPHFLHPTAEEIVSEREQRILRAENERLEALRVSEEQEQREAQIAADKAKLRSNDERRLRSVNEERIQAAAEVTKMPTQKYLAEYVMQAVTKGMTHVSALRPEDPVNALADFLFEYQPNDAL